MLDYLTKSVFELFAGTQEDRDHAQEQLKPVLERRFQPCLELWPHLWEFGVSPDANDKQIADLSNKIGAFLKESGALVSFSCLRALVEFQAALKAIEPGDDLAHDVKVSACKKLLVPSTEKDNKGNAVTRPGLLLLLRDEVGSNARSASSALKQ
ncbi:MAG TPA: hypothetical protein VFM11_07180 [Burkholderiales bacterium]|nr:hypothetical protein [Burkholderiales bacterium]